jgi:hypothetical protein
VNEPEGKRAEWQRSPERKRFSEGAALVVGWTIVFAFCIPIWAGALWLAREIIR